MKPRTRRAVAVGRVALIVFAAVLPLGGVSLEWLVVTPAWAYSSPRSRRSSFVCTASRATSVRLPFWRFSTLAARRNPPL